MSKITVITEPAAEADTLGLLDAPRVLTELDTERLRHSFADLSAAIGSLLQDIRTVGDFKLEEVTVAVEISAEGGVALIGNAKAGAKGAIHLTFSR
ncbi:MAG: hypothetical protein LGR52_13540 [Candidatus Thiosymbion ectosymbiont of Robbea hypermnestra]|nr:hypothetical protein [Candidatus Thiosymbion ectosymbiont of Robbea hypermnestra]